MSQSFELLNVMNTPDVSPRSQSSGVPVTPLGHLSGAIKHDVRLDNLSTQMLLAALIIIGVFNKYGFDGVISSGSEGHHSRKSLHPRGNALDWRTRAIGVPESVSKEIADELRARLGPHFDVLWKPSHIHTEYDPEPPAAEDYPSRKKTMRA